MRQRQTPGDKRCTGFAAVAATGHTIEDFERWVQSPPPWTTADAAAWLKAQGYVCGWQDVTFGSDGVLHKQAEFTVRLDLNRMNALLGVRSRNHPGVQHLVFWNGQKVIDSDPNTAEEGEPIEHYAVVSICPISGKGEVPLPRGSVNLLQVDPLPFADPIDGSFATECSYGDGCPVCAHFNESRSRKL